MNLRVFYLTRRGLSDGYSQRRSSLLPGAAASASWCIRVCSRVRLWLVPRSLTNTDKEGTWCGWARVCYI